MAIAETIPAYDRITIVRRAEALVLERNCLTLPMEHWHYDMWVVAESDLFAIHLPPAFDRANTIRFETARDGRISAVSIALEPAVSAIRFKKDRTEGLNLCNRSPPHSEC